MHWDLIPANPARRTQPPAVSRPHHRTWTPEQVRQFLNFTAGDPLHAAFRLACTTGMRRAEILGLRWADVDLDAGHVTINQTLVSVSYELRFSEPKTGRSRRTIPLDRTTVRVLRRHRTTQARQRLEADQP